MHTPGAQVLKSVHPTVKMCTQGAGFRTLKADLRPRRPRVSIEYEQELIYASYTEIINS